MENYNEKPKYDLMSIWWLPLAVGIVIAFVFLVVFSASCAHSQEISVDMQKIKMIESSGNPMAHNKRDDSRGLYQITPICLKEYNNFHPNAQYSMNDLWDEKINFRISDWYFSKRIPQLLRHYKIKDSVKNRIWAYNAGIGNVVKGRVPEITKLYFKKYGI